MTKMLVMTMTIATNRPLWLVTYQGGCSKYIKRCIWWSFPQLSAWKGGLKEKKTEGNLQTKLHHKTYTKEKKSCTNIRSDDPANPGPHWSGAKTNISDHCGEDLHGVYENLWNKLLYRGYGSDSVIIIGHQLVTMENDPVMAKRPIWAKTALPRTPLT